MDDAQVQYYHDMLARDRAVMVIKDDHLVSIVTFFVGDDDVKYLTGHTPWTLVDDDPEGTTLYIDQWLTYKGRETHSFVHREFTKLLKGIRKRFPNIKRAKWIRVGSQFRKHGKLEGVNNGRTINCKNFKF
jgi:hypothetical protein